MNEKNPVNVKKHAVGRTELSPGLAAVDLWRAICEEAECVVLPGNNGGKRLLLTEEMCERMGAALGC